jgi:NhaA family Na+:H+ antiporter
MAGERPQLVNFLQEFSVPLIAGVLFALAAANLNPEGYQQVVHWKLFGDVAVFGHDLDLHFLINDVFMVFFFGIAAKEITEACLPGGSLNPLRKAVNPLVATIGGVVGPVAVFFAALAIFRSAGAFDAAADPEVLRRGWGIPTATDIALAWLVARAVFGAGHPAIDFLLLLAVADDAIGLAIIAIFYGDPANPARPAFLLVVVLGIAVALALRLARVRSWVPYVFLAGPITWSGLMLAHLHPALALVFVVPFLPGPGRDPGLFVEEAGEHSTLHNFEHQLKLLVDLGLFFFAFANAGVLFAEIGAMTWIVLASLVVGKTIGITLFAWLAVKVGFPLPERIGLRELVTLALVAALGLTVALFVAGAAYAGIDASLEGQAKMGALLSGLVAFAAIALGAALRVRGGRGQASDEPSDEPA